MILHDLMKKGFLSSGLQDCPENSINSKNSTFKDSTTSFKVSSSSLKKKHFQNTHTAIPAIPAIFVLPDNCPLKDGGSCPSECRFETRFFRRMLSEGVLQVNGPCPVRGVCLMDKFSRETGRKDEVLNADPSEWEETLL